MKNDILRAALAAACLATAACSSAIVRGGPTFDAGTLNVDGLQTGIGVHAEAVGYDADEGGGYGVGAALAIAGYTSDADGDPILFSTLEARYRLPIAPRRDGARMYWEFGSGVGAAWGPAAHRVAVPIQIELGMQKPVGGAILTIGLRDRFIALLGSGSPSVDGFNSVQLLLGIGVR